jgi:hypothetical protein
MLLKEGSKDSGTMNKVVGVDFIVLFFEGGFL